MKIINLKIKWHKTGWAQEGENGELYYNPKIEILESSEPNLTDAETSKIKKEIEKYEQSQAGGEQINNNELDTMLVRIF